MIKRYHLFRNFSIITDSVTYSLINRHLPASGPDLVKFCFIELSVGISNGTLIHFAPD